MGHFELDRAALFCEFQTFFFLYRIKACLPCDIIITAWFLVFTFETMTAATLQYAVVCPQVATLG